MKGKATLRITGACERAWKAGTDSDLPVSSRDEMRQISDGASAFESSELTARVVGSCRREEKKKSTGTEGRPVIFKTQSQVISTAGAAITGAQAMRRIASSLAALPTDVRSVAPKAIVGLASCCTIGVTICTSVLPSGG
ncbi:hypothetical protein N7533_007241 [Penicillium manginii]|jgi:hypothetical protein|uniref:uncharacterized protein n=1 Tax=Penicillium manginii TaxID=203109 RepID=UPI00254882AB|nr:uncharacterized protein N7533_007241 [Penicillium manginii]KAJ5750213.1 hypothetical protein N7533_007241 [Penicillium manginii]